MKRNLARFPADFMYLLPDTVHSALMSPIATSIEGPLGRNGRQYAHQQLNVPVVRIIGAHGHVCGTNCSSFAGMTDVSFVSMTRCILPLQITDITIEEVNYKEGITVAELVRRGYIKLEIFDLCGREEGSTALPPKYL